MHTHFKCTSLASPRHSTHQQPPRHSTGQLEPTHHRHDPRPRLAEHWTARPPPPDQAGSSAWQHQPDPTSAYVFRHDLRLQVCFFIFILVNINWACISSLLMFVHPTGSYGYQPYGHDASMSGSGWDSDHEGGHNRQDFLSQHNEWMDIYTTPAPPPTQETQHDQAWSELPPRNVRAPHRYLWPTPPTPPPRRGGRRG